MTAGRPIRVSTKAGAHKCAVDGCNVQVPALLLMCTPHWRMVSPAAQRRVWTTYDGLKAKTVEAVQAYRFAVDAAKQSVAHKTSPKVGDVKPEVKNPMCAWPFVTQADIDGGVVSGENRTTSGAIGQP